MNRQEVGALFLTVAAVVISVAVSALFLLNNPLLLTLVVTGYVLSIWRGARFHWNRDAFFHKELTSWIGALASLSGYIIIFTVSREAALLASEPPALLIIMGVAFFMYSIYQRIAVFAGGLSGTYKFLTVAALSLAAFLLVFGIVFNFSWANVGGLVGQAGYNLQNTVVGAPIGVASEAYDSVAAQLSVCNNRRVAQLQCTGDLYFGGAVYEAAAGSSSVSKCVEQKIENQCGGSKSKKVTEPLVVRAENTVIEPLRDKLRVTVPVTNTLVTDIQGRPIDIPARDVTVTVMFKYLDETVASAKQTGLQIQNGDTATVDFDENGGKPVFPRVPLDELSSSISQTAIKQQLLAVKKQCANADYGDGGSCTNAVDWFLNGFRGKHTAIHAPDMAADATLSPERVAFILQTETSIEPTKKTLEPKLYSWIGPYIGPNMQILPGREYRVITRVEYSYMAEAAFTKSSRWQSGNHLLKLFTKPAWQNLSAAERRSWRQSNCKEVTRGGVTFRKQRTAALTTPVIPVMYTDCAGTLFDNFNAPKFTYNVPISIGATVNDDLQDRIAEKGFKITGAETNCRKNGPHADDLQPVAGKVGDAFQGDKNGWYVKGENGFLVSPEQVERKNVKVNGEQKTIGCRVNMTMRVRLDQTSRYPESGGGD